MKIIKVTDFANQKILDFEVIDKVLDGEIGLFEILMRRNNQKLFRAVRSYIDDEVLIKDIMQDTYVKAYENLNTFKKKSSFSTWLIRIGINQALQELKSKKNKVIAHPSYTSENISERKSTQMNPEKRIIEKEAQWILEKTIDTLPEKYKIAYMLSEVEGMTIKDISECLEISEGNVKVRIHRSRQMLKDKLFELSQKPNVFEFGFEKCDALVNNVISQL